MNGSPSRAQATAVRPKPRNGSITGAAPIRLKGLLAKAHAIGLTHPRTGRHLFKSELHRMLQNSIYTGDFVWDGTAYKGSHQPLITRDAFDEVQAVLRRKPRARYPKQRYASMGL